MNIGDVVSYVEFKALMLTGGNAVPTEFQDFVKECTHPIIHDITFTEENSDAPYRKEYILRSETPQKTVYFDVADLDAQTVICVDTDTYPTPRMTAWEKYTDHQR
jgi:hypothetical protein